MNRPKLRHSPILVVSGLILLTAITLGRTAGHSFLNLDDDRYITGNPHLQDGLSVSGLAWAVGTDYQAVWIPVTWISFLSDHQWFGLNPRGYHLTNLVLHTANALLLFFLLRAWTGALWRPALVAALFAVHPLNAEPVAWVTGRKDVLFLFFGLGSLLAWRWRLLRGGWRPYAAALVLAILAMAAKPMAVVLPVLLHLLDGWPGQRYPQGFTARRFGALLVEKIPFWAAAVAVAVIARATALGGEWGAPASIPVAERTGRAGLLVLTYLQRIFFPTGLAIHYPVATLAWSWPVMIAGAAVLGLLSLLVWRYRNQAPWLALGWFWYLLTLVPVVDLVQGGQQLLSDRYCYLPAIGIFVALAWGLAALSERFALPTTASVGLGLAAILAFSGVSHVQAGYWRDNESVFRRALAVTDRNHLAHLNLAIALDQQDRTPEALRHAEDSVSIKRTADGLYNLGNILLRLENSAAAAEAYRDALRLRPGLAEAHSNLGLIAGNAGDLEQAETQFRLAIAADPDLIVARSNLARLLAATQRPSEALKEIREILDRQPDHSQALRLRETLVGQR